MKQNQQHSEPLSFEKVWLMFQETERVLNEKFQDTDKKFQETERVLNEKFQDTDKKLNKLEYLFTSQWGKLIESLVEGDLINLLKARGIDISNTFCRNTYNYEGQNGEIDIIAANGKDAVVVEVKTTLRPDDVTKFIKGNLHLFKKAFKRFADCNVYGAVTFLRSESNAHIMAERQGLYVIRATGNSAAIINKKEFKPKEF